MSSTIAPLPAVFNISSGEIQEQSNYFLIFPFSSRMSFSSFSAYTCWTWGILSEEKGANLDSWWMTDLSFLLKP